LPLRPLNNFELRLSLILRYVILYFENFRVGYTEVGKEEPIGL